MPRPAPVIRRTVTDIPPHLAQKVDGNHETYLEFCGNSCQNAPAQVAIRIHHANPDTPRQHAVACRHSAPLRGIFSIARRHRPKVAGTLIAAKAWSLAFEIRGAGSGSASFAAELPSRSHRRSMIR